MLDEADAGQAFCLVQTTVVYTTELSVPTVSYSCNSGIVDPCIDTHFLGAGGGAVKY